MKLTRCSLDQFGKLTDKEFDLADGFNLICGSRGSGRTFLATAARYLRRSPPRRKPAGGRSSGSGTAAPSAWNGT